MHDVLCFLLVVQLLFCTNQTGILVDLEHVVFVSGQNQVLDDCVLVLIVIVCLQLDHILWCRLLFLNLHRVDRLRKYHGVVVDIANVDAHFTGGAQLWRTTVGGLHFERDLAFLLTIERSPRLDPACIWIDNKGLIRIRIQNLVLDLCVLARVQILRLHLTDGLVQIRILFFDRKIVERLQKGRDLVIDICRRVKALNHRTKKMLKL